MKKYENTERESKKILTGANPIAITREPLEASRGFSVELKTELLALAAKRSKHVVSFLIPITLPISFSPFFHSFSLSKVRRAARLLFPAIHGFSSHEKN